MPKVKTSHGMKKFPYTARGEMAAKKFEKKEKQKMMRRKAGKK